MPNASMVISTPRNFLQYSEIYDFYLQLQPPLALKPKLMKRIVETNAYEQYHSYATLVVYVALWELLNFSFCQR